MQKRNLIADAFFEGISAFSEQSGAIGFDSRAEYFGVKKKGGLSKMICVASYADYDIEYVYTASGGINMCSAFNFRIIFDRSMPNVKYSPYDIMYKIDETNFRCYTYSYIESPERMKDLIEALTPELYDLLPELDALCRRKADMSDIFDKFADNVNAFYGKDIFRAADDADDEEFERFMDSYYRADDAFYASKPYAQFLRGDYNSAYNGMRRVKNKSYYQIRLMSFIASLDYRYEAVPEGCDTTGDAVFSVKTNVLRTVICTLVLIIPCAAALAGIHFLSSAVIYRGAIWSDAWFIINALRYVSSAVIPAFVLSRYMRGATLLFFKPERRKYLAALDSISSNRGSSCLLFVANAATVMIAVSVVLSANSYAAFYDDVIRLPSQSSIIASDNYSYSDVEKLIHAEGTYSIYGMFVPGDQYIIALKNGKEYMLSYEVTGKTVREKIIPIFEEKGVPVVTVHDADDVNFIP